MLRIILLAVVSVVAMAIPVSGATLSELIEGIRDRAVYIDSVRISDSLLKRWFNLEQEAIATTGLAIEKDTTIVMVADVVAYSLPSDYYLFHAVTLNIDSLNQAGPDNRPNNLVYVPYKDIGRVSSYPTGRPTQFSVWGDSLFVDKFTMTEQDVLEFKYFSHATDMLDGDSSMVLPDQYEDVLIEKVFKRCFDRVFFTQPDPGKPKESEDLFKANRFGRPEDEH